MLADYAGPALLDRNGGIGRALRIPVVPYTVTLDGSGMAVRVRLGLTFDEEEH
jgi:hypothetical protein